MSRFNLSEWALANRPLVLFAMLLVAIIGIGSYRQLSQSEDPPFTFKAMVVQTQWPGATAEQVAENTGFPIADLESAPVTADPTAEQLQLIREVLDPKNLRDREVKA